MKKIIFLLTVILIFNQSLFSQTRAYTEFKDNEYYYMLAGEVRIRSQPNLNGEILGMLPLNARIKILPRPSGESSQPNNPQIIDGVAAYWYYVEYENITDYIWGGYISIRTLVCDIDNNGINDYFHYRVSSLSDGPGYYEVDAFSDVIIYINNKKIPTTNIISTYNSGRSYHTWGNASFRHTVRNTVLIIMYKSMDGNIYEDIFEIDATGNILFLTRREERVY